MPLPNKRPDELYTYADYLNWDEDDRIEIIDGKPVMMAPPSRIHQKVSGELYRQIANYLKGKQCEVYAAPFAVRLFETDEDTPDNIKTIIEPDISVICDKNKLDDRGCKGAPDMVIEILSPSTAAYDALTKLDKYQEAGVKEYWIVDTAKQTVRSYLLDGDFYKTPRVYSPPDPLKVSVLENCTIDLAEVFTE